MESPNNQKTYPVWQLTDGTVVVQSESDITEQLKKWAEKNKLSLVQRIRHSFFKLLEQI